MQKMDNDKFSFYAEMFWKHPILLLLTLFKFHQLFDYHLETFIFDFLLAYKTVRSVNAKEIYPKPIYLVINNAHFSNTFCPFFSYSDANDLVCLSKRSSPFTFNSCCELFGKLIILLTHFHSFNSVDSDIKYS